MRVLNAIDREFAADVRAAISGKPRLKEAKAPKAPPGPKAMVTQLHRVYTATHTHVIQLPIAFNCANYNSSRAPWYLKERAIKSMRETVWLALAAYVPNMRSADIISMEFVRLAINKMDARDNLPAAFKAIVDATCSRLEWGDEAPARVKQIGQADDKLEQRGVTWTYRQQKYEANPRAYGIQIWLHCAPPSSE